MLYVKRLFSRKTKKNFLPLISQPNNTNKNFNKFYLNCNKI